MVDTRAGLVLAAISLLLVLLPIVTDLWRTARSKNTFTSLIGDSLGGLVLLMPILGVLLVTSEWSQRTAPATFTLVPNRGRLVAAKGLAALLFGTAIGVFSLVTAALAFTVGGLLHRTGGSWSISPWLVPFLFLWLYVVILQGAAIGLLIRNSALAITTFLLLPTVWTVVANVTPGLKGAAAWVDLHTALVSVTDVDRMTGADGAHIGTALLLWLVLPTAGGVLRLVRTDVA